MSAMVDWDFAQKVAAKVAKREPFADSYHYDSLAPDFEEFTAQAELLVAETTGLPLLAGNARGRVTDRAGWVNANINSFQRLLRPLFDKIEDKAGGSTFEPVTRRAAGAEVGALLGWMSTRVLGQYDLLIIEDERPEDQDIVYYVGPNVLALEKRFAFPPREFRLWLALHECTHRAQFTGVPWLREYFLGMVNETLDNVDPDAGGSGSIKTVIEGIRSGENSLADGGLAMLFASPEQRQVVDKITGLMSLLEGHGDVTMDRAGADFLPSAERFSRVLKQRRQSAKGMTKVVQRLMGLEAKLAQYAQGEAFIEVVENAGGAELFDHVWEGPQWLPTIDEIRDPQEWIDRVRLSEAVGS